MKEPVEFQLNDTEQWERGGGEPQRAYQAFLMFRNLGPTRTLHAAYRAWREERGAAAADASGLRGPSGARIAPSATRKIWRVDFRWDERAAAYDRSLDSELRARIAESHRQLVKEKLQSNAADWERIQRLQNRVQELDEKPLEKIQGKVGDQTITRDLVREYGALAKELRSQLDRRYAPIEAV